MAMTLDYLWYAPRMTSAKEPRQTNKRCQGATLCWCGKPATHTLVNPVGDVFGCCDCCKDEFENKIFPRMILDMQEKYCDDCNDVLDSNEQTFQNNLFVICLKCYEKRMRAMWGLEEE